MKKLLLLPMLVLVFFIACQKEKDTTTETTAITQTSKDATPTGAITTPPAGVVADDRSANQISICHYSIEDNSWHVIEISANAWPAHQAHGDAQLVDGDNDGYVAAENHCVPGSDCNDNDGSIHPEADDVCDDNIDNDCDGDVDEDCGCPEIEGLLLVTLPDGSCLYVRSSDQIYNPYKLDWGGNEINITDLDDKSTVIAATEDLTGEENTEKIVTQVGSNYGVDYAAKSCYDLVADGYTDWYLPSAGELNAVWQQLGPNGSNILSNDVYWSSTESSAFNKAWILNATFGLLYESVHYQRGDVRCVRRD